LDVFDLVITDSRVDPAVLDAWTASGIKYRVAAVDPAVTAAVPPMRAPLAGEVARL
jgi:hypothetical protein